MAQVKEDEGISVAKSGEILEAPSFCFEVVQYFLQKSCIESRVVLLQEVHAVADVRLFPSNRKPWSCDQSFGSNLHTIVKQKGAGLHRRSRGCCMICYYYRDYWNSQLRTTATSDRLATFDSFKLSNILSLEWMSWTLGRAARATLSQPRLYVGDRADR